MIIVNFMWPYPTTLTSINCPVHESGLGGGADKFLEGHTELVRRRGLEIIKIKNNLLETLYLNVIHRYLSFRPGEGVWAV